MNDFVNRIDSIPPDRTAVRAVAPVATVQSGGASAQPGHDSGAEARNEQSRRDHMVSVADYAKMQARVADILANLSASTAPRSQALGEADAQIGALNHAPQIIVPMLPASRDVVEHALEVAHDIAQQAMLARAAQANVHVGTVDQVVA